MAVADVGHALIVRSISALLDVAQVTAMPRSMREILDQQHELAKVFEEYEPDPADRRPAESLRAARAAHEAAVRAQAAVLAAVSVARADRHSWNSIGAMLGTSGEAARQRYGPLVGPQEL